MAEPNGTITLAREASIQARATEEGYGYGGMSILSFLTYAGEIVAPWWSHRRDTELRRFWKGSDHLGGAVYAVRTKVTTLPFQVIPRDMSVKAHARMAERMEGVLGDAEFGEGWDAAIGKFIEDVLTCDNGGFMEVIGDGEPDGPIEGQALGLAHLDSGRCQRTSSPEFPVLYEDTSGKLYKLHYSRVISVSQMTSPQVEMRGVGFCSVSRAIHTGQNLMDIARYKQEKLGSRPPRQLIVGKGISTDEIVTAYKIAAMQMDNAGLDRYSQNVVIGSRQKDIDILIKDLASAPDGFDEEKAVTLGMFTIALAFGVDARELWPASASGATKADAMMQHLKARGKAFGSLLGKIENALNRKFLPGYLRLRFDQQDDEQDSLRAEINKVRAEARTANLSSGVVTLRVARERMLDDGEISDAQFEEMELGDGRLPDGQSVLTLFQSNDPRMQELLGGVDPDAPDETLLNEIIRRNEGLLFIVPNANIRRMVEQSLAALSAVKGEAEAEAMRQQMAVTPPPTDGDIDMQETGGQFRRLPGEEEDEPTALKQGPEEETILSEYDEDLERLTEQALDGEIGEETFREELTALALAALLLMFLRGSGKTQEQMTRRERKALNESLDIHRESAEGLAADIFGGVYETDEDVRGRLTLWRNRLSEAYERGLLYRADDPQYRWDVGATDHCSDCADNNGQVKRASEWLAMGMWPMSANLECQGYRCQCSFSEVRR